MSISYEDLTGRKFNRLTVVEKLPKYKKGRTYYRCVCDCGNEKIVYVSDLKDGTVSSCGCYRRECKRKDITGQRFGKLVAIRPLYSNEKQSMVWECKCDCGNTHNVGVSALLSGNTQSCGCKGAETLRNNLEDLTGKRFGKLTVIEYAYSKNDARHWKCLCDCGNYSYPTSYCLTGGHSKSCGCLNYEPTNTTHGLSKKTPLYFVWKELRHRCSNKNHKSYINYGGRGIKVCKQWEDFKVFYDWAVENGYKEDVLDNGKNKWTIDRIDVNGNYEPSNCRFITNREQMRNKRNNVKVIFNNKEELLFDLCEKCDMPYSLVYGRIHCYNWSVEDALKFPKGVSRWKKSTT